jgi:polar amino acid transport system substrate-binding protein
MSGGDAVRLVYSDVEAFPIQMGDGETIPDPPGIVLDILAKAAAELGLKVIFERRPNERVFAELEQGIADGAFSFSYKEERAAYGAYPTVDGKLDGNRRLVTISYYLYKKAGSPVQWDGAAFSSLDGVIGANSGYSIVGDLRKLGVNVEEAKTTQQNFLKLADGRIAGFAHQDITADLYVASGEYGDIEKLPIPLATKDYFLMLSHQFVEAHPDLARALWDKIGQIRDETTRESAPKYERPLGKARSGEQLAFHSEGEAGGDSLAAPSRRPRPKPFRYPA